MIGYLCEIFKSNEIFEIDQALKIENTAMAKAEKGALPNSSRTVRILAREVFKDLRARPCVWGGSKEPFEPKMVNVLSRLIPDLRSFSLAWRFTPRVCYSRFRRCAPREFSRGAAARTRC
jgi:hypothetical protein